MCLFCCDMLCWFSFITCCGCRDMVTRRLVFFPPPDPYYDHIEPNEHFSDFYHRLSSKPNSNTDSNSEDSKQEPSNPINNAENTDDIVLEVGTHKRSKLKKAKTKPTKNTNNESEALNSSDETDISKHTFGTFRIRDDDTNLSDFYWNNYAIKMGNFESQYLLTKNGNTIPSYYIKHTQSQYCILFSHGNAADIGLMRNHLCRMYQKCKVSIFAYEYSGYGKSSGKASEKNTYADIECAYKYCIDILEIRPANLILYGQSLGTCVSVYLASHFVVGGVILHSPLMSGLRVMQHFDKTYWFDIYPVVDQIQHVFAPVFVIHGNKDKEIDVMHGKILSRIAPNAYQPWFVPYAGHNDIEVLFPDVLFKKVSKFVKYLKKLETVYLNDTSTCDRDETVTDMRDDDTTVTDMGRYKRVGVSVVKSVTHKVTDQSISPPPPTSIMTKSRDPNSMRQIALPSRKFSNTGVSDDESVLKTPSVGDSMLISISMKENEKSGNKGYDTVLTPTMRTIHSKEQSTSEMLALPHTIDDSQTYTKSALHFRNDRNKHRKSRKNVLRTESTNIAQLTHGDIDEEKESVKKRKYHKNKRIERLNLPHSNRMRANIGKCLERRERLMIASVNGESESESSECDLSVSDIDETKQIHLQLRDERDSDDSCDDLQLEQTNQKLKKNVSK